MFSPCQFSSPTFVVLSKAISFLSQVGDRLDRAVSRVSAAANFIFRTGRNSVLTGLGYNKHEIAAIIQYPTYRRYTFDNILKYAPISMGIASVACVMSSSSPQFGYIILTMGSIIRLGMRILLRERPKNDKNREGIIVFCCVSSPFLTLLAVRLSSGSWYQGMLGALTFGTIMMFTLANGSPHSRKELFIDGQALVQSSMWVEMSRRLAAIFSRSVPFQISVISATALASYVVVSHIERPETQWSYNRKLIYNSEEVEHYQERYSFKHAKELLPGLVPCAITSIFGTSGLANAAAITSIAVPSFVWGAQTSHKYALHRIPKEQIELRKLSQFLFTRHGIITPLAILIIQYALQDREAVNEVQNYIP